MRRNAGAVLLPLAVGLAFAAATMAWSLLAGSVVYDDGAWRTPGDFWFAAGQAEYVASGALPYVYEADARYLSLPAWPIVLAPAVAASEGLGLVLYRPGFPNPRPSSWPLLGSFALTMAALAFVPVHAAMQAREWRRRFVYLLAIGALVYLPAASRFGHHEDVIAIGLVVAAERARQRGKLDRAALILGAAIAFKTLTLVALAPFLVLFPAPTTRRVRAAAVALVLPAALAAITLTADWAHASRNLFESHTHLGFGHVLPFLHRATATGAAGAIDAGLYRTAGLAAGLAAGAWVASRRPDGPWLAYAAAFLPRLLTEPTIHPYYAAPVVALALIAAADRWQPATAAVALGIWVAWTPANASSIAWWIVFWGITAALVVVTLGERRPGIRRTHPAPRPTYPR